LRSDQNSKLLIKKIVY